MMPSNEMDELMEEYASEEGVAAASREKEAGEDDAEDIGVLVKNYPKVQRDFDLHGMTGSEAMTELTNFIDRCIHQRVLTVRVVTGKGLHSEGFKSVLPELTEKKLGELRRAKKVLAFKREKSSGAFLVYLIA
jgi:DNA-nicking Smr family endonuclease